MFGFRDAAKAISHTPLVGPIGEKLLYTIGLAFDASLEKLNQGMRLHMPGYGDPSALALIGADRQIPQGPNEPSAAYALRLKRSFDAWKLAGSARSVLQQFLGWISPYSYVARTVTNSSAWDSFIAGQDPTTAPEHKLASPANWNWDGLSTYWWRFWTILFAGTSVAGTSVTGATTASPIVITTSANHGLATNQYVWIVGVEGNLPANGRFQITVLSNTTFSLNASSGIGSYTTGGTVYAIPLAVPAGATNAEAFGPGPVWGATGAVYADSTRSWGLNVPSSTISGLRGILTQWKAANAQCPWMLLSFASTLFDPTQASGGGINPDGTWGHWGKVSGSQYVATRAADARYCDGNVSFLNNQQVSS